MFSKIRWIVAYILYLAGYNLWIYWVYTFIKDKMGYQLSFPAAHMILAVTPFLTYPVYSRTGEFFRIVVAAHIAMLEGFLWLKIWTPYTPPSPMMQKLWWGYILGCILIPVITSRVVRVILEEIFRVPLIFRIIGYKA